jgi:hypothetical protein
MCVWYALTGEKEASKWSITENEDIRVETAGQWTRGAYIIDRRGRMMREGKEDEEDEVPGDAGGWLSKLRGNRLSRCIGTPGNRVLASFLLDTIFG